jgi:hypothetical protein
MWLIYRQCTTALKSKLEEMTNFSTAKASNDIIALLKLIQWLRCKFDVKNQIYVALAATFRQTFGYFQDNACSNDDFYHHYKSLLSTQSRLLAGTTQLGSLQVLSMMNLRLLPLGMDLLLPLLWMTRSCR